MLFELYYTYYSKVFYKKTINSYSKLHIANNLITKLNVIMSI